MSATPVSACAAVTTRITARLAISAMYSRTQLKRDISAPKSADVAAAAAAAVGALREELVWGWGWAASGFSGGAAVPAAACAMGY